MHLSVRATAQMETDVWPLALNVGPLAGSQFVSGGSCDWPLPSTFAMYILGPRANTKFATKFHFALHASREALKMLD
jgi:hypothetical protein